MRIDNLEILIRYTMLNYQKNDKVKTTLETSVKFIKNETSINHPKIQENMQNNALSLNNLYGRL